MSFLKVVAVDRDDIADVTTDENSDDEDTDTSVAFLKTISIHFLTSLIGKLQGLDGCTDILFLPVKFTKKQKP